QEVHQRDDVGRHQIVAVRLVVPAAAAVAAAVHDDDAIARLEGLDLVAPVIRVGEPAMQQNDWLALWGLRAEAGVPDLDAVDRGITALPALRQGRGRWQNHPLRLGMRYRCEDEARNGEANKA